ncbi:MAG: OmpA/MotB family protein [Candidatus Hydrothermia bacterium]|jgi:flagellar motor protein MotB
MKRSKYFNFWPPFVDFMLFVVLLFAFIFSISYALLLAKFIDLGRTRECQTKTLNLLESNKKFQKLEMIDKDNYILYFKDGSFDFSIRLINELQLQRIRVSSGLLFNKNEYKISENGYKVLEVIGNAIKNNLNCIERIQIEGHADIDPTTKFRSNLELAGLRSFEIFYFLKDSVKIDPSEHLISATSFGEYKPVNREEGKTFNLDSLLKANENEEKKSLNRRVEFLIFYKR